MSIIKLEREFTNLPALLLGHLVTLLYRLLPAFLRGLFPALSLRNLLGYNINILPIIEWDTYVDTNLTRN